MSDMSRPYPLPTSPDHELHDPLLVAQFAAGDALDPSEHAKAELWATSCGACASLAAELRAVSGAVAWEPTPARRRDYRISEERAEQLRGGRFSRLMHRLALPSSSGLRPAAAGVLSFGLLLMVASAAWPGDEVVGPVAEPASAPAGPMAPATGADPDDALVRAEASLPPQPAAASEEDASFADTPDAAADAPEAATGAEAAEPLGELEAAAEGLGPPEVAADELARKSVATEERAGLLDLETEAANSSLRLDEDGELVTEDAAAQAVDEAEPIEMPGPGEVFTQGGDSADPRESRDRAVVEGEAGGVARLEEAQPLAGDANVDAGASDDGLDIERLLLAVGLALAIGGAAALVLMWLARRRTDPLLR